jgi:hypothetical protein
MRGIALVAGALIAALIVVGCGGGDSDDVSTSAVSKAAFAKKADAICEKGTKRLAVAFAAYFKREKSAVGNQSQAEEEDLVRRLLVPSVRREVKEFQALGAPSGDEDQVGEIVKALEEGLETAESNPAAVVSSSDAVFGISSRLAKEYGLEVCGSR